MPLYEYECGACGHRFEKIQKFSDALESVCPKCGGVVRKLMSSPAIQFKGSGFYITDYAKKDQGGEGKAGDKPRDGARAEDAKAEKAEKDAKSDGAKTDTAGKAGGAGGAEKSKPDKSETASKTEKAASTDKPA